MFAATMTLTVGGTGYVLNRLNQDNYGSEYRYSDANRSITLLVRHSRDNPDRDGLAMVRHNLFVEHVVYPTPTTAMEKYTSTTTIRHGEYNAPAGAADLVKAVNVLLAASSSQMVTDLSVGIN